MSALDRTLAPAVARIRPALGVRAARFVGDTLKAWQNRGQMRRLHELSDRDLADIGLRRSDLVVAESYTVLHDPTRELQRLARERHRLEDAARRVS